MPQIHVRTPVWESPALSAAAGGRVLLKMEAFQPVGSFKARAMGGACNAAKAAGATQVVCASGGNAGYAVAYAARVLGMQATIVVPVAASPRNQALIQGEGAALVLHGRSFDDANERAQAIAAETGASLVHPFDDPRVWAGNATLVEELAADGVKPGLIVLSVGGGGLLCGVVAGLHAAGWGDVPVLAVETDGAASYAAALAAGQPVRIAELTSIAVTLGARQVAQRAVDLAATHTIQSWLVSDADAVRACLRFADDHRVLVEPACGAALAPVYAGVEPVRAAASTGAPIMVVVCGGAGVSREQLSQWERDLL
jgi:L-serine/L-threonine ammonia-lyase